jgi:hypothetical protein
MALAAASALCLSFVTPVAAVRPHADFVIAVFEFHAGQGERSFGGDKAQAGLLAGGEVQGEEAISRAREGVHVLPERRLARRGRPESREEVATPRAGLP